MREFLGKRDETEEAPVTAETPTEPVVAQAESESEVEAQPTETEHYRIGTWKGRPNYECKYCPYSTVDGERDIEEHVTKKHLAGHVRRASMLIGPNGRPL
jgi:hypothetical protein